MDEISVLKEYLQRDYLKGIVVIWKIIALQNVKLN